MQVLEPRLSAFLLPKRSTGGARRQNSAAAPKWPCTSGSMCNLEELSRELPGASTLSLRLALLILDVRRPGGLEVDLSRRSLFSASHRATERCMLRSELLPPADESLRVRAGRFSSGR